MKRGSAARKPVEPVGAIEPNWGWQDDAFKWAEAHFEQAGHGYLNAPMATGKTRVAFRISEAVGGPGTRITVVGQRNLAQQHAATYVEDLKAAGDRFAGTWLRTPQRHDHLVTTWQALAAALSKAPSKRDPRLNDIAFIIFDETHMGGTGGSNTSWKKIRKEGAPNKVLYVSATLNAVSEPLLGARVDHEYVYHLKQAYDDGILHPVELIQLDCGLDAEIREIIDRIGPDNYERAEDGDGTAGGLRVVNASSALDMRDKLEAANTKVIPASDVERIFEIACERGEAMVIHYLRHHAGESVIFFMPNVRVAAHIQRFLSNQAMIRLRQPFVAHLVTGTVEDQAALIDDFKNKKATAVVAVQLMCEGFDLPHLALAYDARMAVKFNIASTGRFLQRCGRVMRKDKDAFKPESRYYMGRTVLDYWRKFDDIDKMDVYERREVKDDAAAEAATLRVVPQTSAQAHDDTRFAEEAGKLAVQLREIDAIADALRTGAQPEFDIEPAVIERETLVMPEGSIRAGRLEVTSAAIPLVRTRLSRLGERSFAIKRVDFRSLLGRVPDRWKELQDYCRAYGKPASTHTLYASYRRARLIPDRLNWLQQHDCGGRVNSAPILTIEDAEEWIALLPPAGELSARQMRRVYELRHSLGSKELGAHLMVNTDIAQPVETVEDVIKWIDGLATPLSKIDNERLLRYRAKFNNSTLGNHILNNPHLVKGRRMSKEESPAIMFSTILASGVRPDVDTRNYRRVYRYGRNKGWDRVPPQLHPGAPKHFPPVPPPT